MKYDTKCFGYERSAFLAKWLHMSNAQSFKYVEKEQLQGYATIRKAESGFKVGPLFAESEGVADALFQACLSHADGRAVYLDIPTVNQGAINLVKKYKGTYVFECARMYHGPAPQIDMNKVFGITSFELG